jgi:hypothetical protein
MRASIRNIVTTVAVRRELRQDPLHHHELLEALDLGVAGDRQIQLAHAADREQPQQAESTVDQRQRCWRVHGRR